MIIISGNNPLINILIIKSINGLILGIIYNSPLVKISIIISSKTCLNAFKKYSLELFLNILLYTIIGLLINVGILPINVPKNTPAKPKYLASIILATKLITASKIGKYLSSSNKPPAVFVRITA